MSYLVLRDDLMVASAKNKVDASQIADNMLFSTKVITLESHSIKNLTPSEVLALQELGVVKQAVYRVLAPESKRTERFNVHYFNKEGFEVAYKIVNFDLTILDTPRCWGDKLMTIVGHDQEGYFFTEWRVSA